MDALDSVLSVSEGLGETHERTLSAREHDRSRFREHDRETDTNLKQLESEFMRRMPGSPHPRDNDVDADVVEGDGEVQRGLYARDCSRMCTYMSGGEATVASVCGTLPVMGYWRILMSSSKRREDPRPSPSGRDMGLKTQRARSRSGARHAEAGTPPVVSDTCGAGEGCKGGGVRASIPESGRSARSIAACRRTATGCELMEAPTRFPRFTMSSEKIAIEAWPKKHFLVSFPRAKQVANGGNAAREAKLRR